MTKPCNWLNSLSKQKALTFLDYNRNTYYLLGLILLIAFLLRFAYQQLYPAEFSTLYIDYWGTIAESLYMGEGYTVEGRFSAFRGPGYPLFLFVLFKIFGLYSFIPLLTNFVLETGTTFLIFLIIKKLDLSNALALVGALLYAIFIPQFGVITVLASEYFFTFLVSLAMYIYVRNNSKIIYLFLFGVFLGLISVTRPEGIYFFYMLIFIQVFSKKFKQVIFHTLGFVLIVAPWIVFSSIQIGELNKMDQLAGYNLINKNYMISYDDFWEVSIIKGDLGKFLDRAFEKRGLDRSNFSGLWGNIEIYDRIGKEEFYELVKEKPLKSAYLMLIKFIHHSTGVQMLSEPTRFDIETMFLQIPLLIIFIIGLRDMLRSKNDFILLSTIIIILTFAIHTLSNPQPRGMFSIIPMLIISNTWYINNKLNKINEN